jgi:hypothetical protein
MGGREDIANLERQAVFAMPEVTFSVEAEKSGNDGYGAMGHGLTGSYGDSFPLGEVKEYVDGGVGVSIEVSRALPTLEGHERVEMAFADCPLQVRFRCPSADDATFKGYLPFPKPRERVDDIENALLFMLQTPHIAEPYELFWPPFYQLLSGADATRDADHAVWLEGAEFLHGSGYQLTTRDTAVNKVAVCGDVGDVLGLIYLNGNRQTEGRPSTRSIGLHRLVGVEEPRVEDQIGSRLREHLPESSQAADPHP